MHGSYDGWAIGCRAGYSGFDSRTELFVIHKNACYYYCSERTDTKSYVTLTRHKKKSRTSYLQNILFWWKFHSDDPNIYRMFYSHYSQFLRGEWPLPWSKLVAVAKAWSGLEGVRVHINRRTDVRNMKSQGKSNKQLMQLCSMFKSNSEGLL